ncbi:MAG: RnfABCDGE type electron transport complex subunit D [Clostridia bacterium]|nr:RnfABCDGE type electron transport complex subunit D [Clostridia bacterium]
MVKEEQIEKKKFTIKEYMIDLIIMLSCLSIMGIYLNGARALFIILICIFTGVLSESFIDFVIRKKIRTSVVDLNTVAHSMIVALCMPVSIPLFFPIIGTLVTVVIGKIPFGESKEQIFVPSAVGLSFLSVAYGEYLFTFRAFEFIKSKEISGINDLSLAGMLKQGKSIMPDAMNVIQVIIGRVTGPIGTTAIILFLGCFIYLAIKRREQLVVIFFYLFAITLVAIISPRVYTGRKISILMELSAGYVLFGSIFMLSDLITSPKNPIARGAYGFFAGILTMLFRHFGKFEDGVFFVVILMNAMSDFFERLGLKIESLSDENKKNKGAVKKVEKKHRNYRKIKKGQEKQEIK